MPKIALPKKKVAAPKKTTAKKTVSKKTSLVKKKKVSYLPKGYHNVTAYLIVDKANKAISFYEKAFGAKELIRMDAPGGKIGHAELKIGDAKIMLADECPEMNAKGPHSIGGTPVSMHIYTKNVDETIKKAVSMGAKLIKPIEDMYYGDRSGSIQDPFGQIWHIATHIEDVSAATMKKRSAEIMKKPERKTK